MAGYAFIILDEVIEDLSDGHSGKKMHAINRIVGLRNKYFDKLQTSSRLSEAYDYMKWKFLEYNRIVRRLYSNDITESIIMMRELQDEMDDPYFMYDYDDNLSAKHRFIDWKVKTLHGSRN